MGKGFGLCPFECSFSEYSKGVHFYGNICFDCHIGGCMAYLYRLGLLFCLLLAAFTGAASAAVPSGVWYTGNYYADTKEELCALLPPDRIIGSYYYSPSYPTYCGGVYAGVTDVAPRAVPISFRASQCPSNSTLNQSFCFCNSGYVEEGSVCVPKPAHDPCELGIVGLTDHCAGVQGTRQRWIKSGTSSGDWTCRAATSIWPEGLELFPGCNRGCLGENVGFDTSYQNDSGDWFSTGQAKMTGSTCDPSVINDLNGQDDPEYQPDPDPKPSEPPDESCPNGFKGTVNGVSVCMPPKASSGVTGLEEKDNGDGTKTNTKTEVKCENGKCEVTKTSTTTNTATNTVVSSSSVNTTTDKKSYCAENKTAGVCQDEEIGGSFSGNCDSGYQCKGDAITCAIAKKQHQDYCEALKSPEHAAYVEAKGKTGKVTGDLEGNRTIDLMNNFGSNRDDFIGSGSCPQDRRIQLLYGELVIPYSQLCPWLEMLGNILVIVSSIAGARIIVTRFS